MNPLAPAICTLCLALTGISFAQEGSRVPSIAEAKAAFDLSAKPLVEPVGEPVMTIANQVFETKGKADEVAKKIDADLVAQGFKQQPGAMFTEQYSSASYEKSGFWFSLNTTSAGKENLITVSMTNLGALDFKKLPKPTGVKEVYVGGMTAIYSSELTPKEAAQKMQELLKADGWEWFGDTTVSFFMRKNASRLQVTCSEPADPKTKSMISFSAEQMSTMLPIPQGLKRVGYNDFLSTVDGDSPLELEEFFKQYRQLLEAQGWKATTDSLLDNRLGKCLLFRNAANDLLELRAHTVEGLSRFELQYLTAEQVKKEEERSKKNK